MIVALAFAVPAMAQDFGPEFGETPEDRLENAKTLNLYNAAIMRSEWGEAAYYLGELLAKAPKAHPGIYSRGIQMYKKRAEATTDPKEKLVMADSLILMHDKFVELFPDAPQVGQMLANKAIFLGQYFANDKVRVLEAFRTGAEAAGGSTPSLLVGYFNELTAAYKSDDISIEEYLTQYSDLSSKLADAGASEQQEQLGRLLVSSGAADCATVEKVFGKIVDDSPEDAEVLDRTIAILNLANCQGEFYMSVAEKLYNVRPSSMTARIIAASYKAKGDDATAARFTQEAIALATTPEEKAEVLLGIAFGDMNDKNFRGMYNNAHEVLQIDPQNATAQYMVAIATAGGASGCAGLGQRAAYWLAYDRMLEARRLATADPKTKPELLQDIENNIARFASAFPTAEELFLEGINEGTAYTVSCGWVSGRTTVRHRP